MGQSIIFYRANPQNIAIFIFTFLADARPGAPRAMPQKHSHGAQLRPPSAFS